MTASKSMPSPAAAPAQTKPQTTETQSELIDRLATEMRTKSGGELPLSFCIEQVKLQLAGKAGSRIPVSETPKATPTRPGGSVFHSWAMPD